MVVQLVTPYQKVHCVKHVNGDAWIAACAEHLKASGKFKLPGWVDVVKTSHAKELSPYDADWLYTRAAALLRRLSVRPDVGIGMLRKLYGCRQRRGSSPARKALAAGGIIRYCLQQFESMGLVEQTEKGGRRLTAQGHKETSTIATQLAHKQRSK